MKRTIIITIIFSLISAYSTYLLFDSMEGFKTEAQEPKIAVKEMQGQVNSIENKYKSEVQYWQSKNHNLIKQIQNTEVALNQSKKKANSLQGKIQKLISPSPTLPDGKGEKVLPFGEDLGGACDSLKEKVNLFIDETNQRDSLCDEEISGLKNLVQNKDSSFAVCEKSFVLMKKVADSSLAMQHSLAEKLYMADKELSKENRKTKFLSAGLFVLSGITATLLLAK